MRRLIIPLLLASVAASPAIAGPDDRFVGPGFRAAPEETGNAVRRSERRIAKAERQQPSSAVEAEGRAAAQAVARADRGSIEAIRAVRPARRLQSVGVARHIRLSREGAIQEAMATDAAPSEPARTVRRRSSGPKMVMAPGADGLRQSDRPLPRVLRDRAPLVTSAPSEGSEPPLRLEGRRGEGTNWATSWRRDGRYDWRRWRDRHRSLFRLGYYRDPFGWGYRPYSIGWRLWPSYYGSNYWIHDPWQYRLPYAPPGYRWIRYYNDAVLIDTWDGRVVDVVRHFFW